MRDILHAYYLANPSELTRDKAAVIQAWRELALSGGRQEIQLTIGGVTSGWQAGTVSQLEAVAKILTEIDYMLNPGSAPKPTRPVRYI